MKQYKRDVALENPGANISSLPPPPPIIDTTQSYDSHKSYYDVSSKHSESTTQNLQNFDTTQITDIKIEKGDGTEPVIGEWRPVTPPPQQNIKQEPNDNDNFLPPSQSNVTQDDDDLEDPEDLSNFKVVEKKLSVDEVIVKEEIDNKEKKITDISFKKRKFKGENKTRNIRKKTD